MKICENYKNYYNNYRPHQGISGKIPSKENITPISSMSFRKQKHFSGDFTTFEAAAA